MSSKSSEHLLIGNLRFFFGGMCVNQKIFLVTRHMIRLQPQMSCNSPKELNI